MLKEINTTKKWKIAIVGAGYMAQEHAKAFASLPNVQIAGVCGRSLPRAKALANTYCVPVFNSVASLYEGTQADVVVIAVQELSAREVCLAAFSHPTWLCLLEKPVGVNLHQAQDITSAALLHGVRAYVALNRRSYSSTRQAIQELATDDGPRLISVLDNQDLLFARNLGQPEEVLRNYMYANSIHLIDYMNLFGRGEILAVEQTQHWNAESPGYVVATVHYSQGDIAVYQAVWNGPGPWSVTVTNSQVRLEMRPLEKLNIQRLGERRLSEAPSDAIDTEFKPGLRYQAEQIIGLLQGQTTTLATLEEATRSMGLCADIYGLRTKP